MSRPLRLPATHHCSSTTMTKLNCAAHGVSGAVELQSFSFNFKDLVVFTLELPWINILSFFWLKPTAGKAPRVGHIPLSVIDWTLHWQPMNCVRTRP